MSGKLDYNFSHPVKLNLKITLYGLDFGCLNLPQTKSVNLSYPITLAV